jgi:formylglycine-generating enzyme required for sulfatase activity
MPKNEPLTPFATFSVIPLCSLCPLWALWFLLLAGCEARGRISAEPTRALAEVAPQPFIETVPGSTVTFAMRPVRIVPESGGAARYLWFAETETTWDAYDVFSLRLDENAGNVAAAGAEGPDAITRPTQPYAPADRGWGHGGYPVISVTHNAATKYCEWLTQKTGRQYRLPTTAEFEAALWDGCGLPSDPHIIDMSWLAEDSDETTHAVATKVPNRKGLFDLSGNVAEWCTEAHRPVVCGGSFRDTFEDLARRVDESPVFTRRQTSDWTIGSPTFPPSRWWLANAPHVGFRVVCEDPRK